MKIKRYRCPKAKQNELILQWGKLPHESPDIVVAWGEGCAKADSRLLMSAFCSKHYNPGTYDSNPSLVDELSNRGYDIETLKFVIKKKN